MFADATDRIRRAIAENGEEIDHIIAQVGRKGRGEKLKRALEGFQMPKR